MSHYYSAKQDSVFRQIPVEVRVRGLSLTLQSAPGVFSAKRLDAGTRLLIENCIAQDGWRILDMGCGYGAVGI